MHLSLIKALNTKANGGRGVACVETIICYLERGDTESARAVFETDGDKIANYPDLETLLEQELGVRGRYKIPLDNQPPIAEASRS